MRKRSSSCSPIHSTAPILSAHLVHTLKPADTTVLPITYSILDQPHSHMHYSQKLVSDASSHSVIREREALKKKIKVNHPNLIMFTNTVSFIEI